MGLKYTIQRIALVITVAMWFACVGCKTETGPPSGHLSGTVTIGGEPLPEGATGSITFRPMGSGGARAVTVQIVNGKYDSPNTPLGQVKAVFDLSKPTGRTYTSERTGKVIEETESIVPAGSTSGIDLEVTGKNAERDFDL